MNLRKLTKWCSAAKIALLYRYSFFRLDKDANCGSKFRRVQKALENRSCRQNSPSNDERPTLKTIAFLTGLGVTTVSRALKDGPEIGEETRQRVKLIAQQIGYRPNRAGVRLRTGKTNVISLILNVQDEGYGFLSAFIYGISQGLADTNYHLIITPYSLADPMEPVRYIVETKSADGIIISRTEANDPRVRYMQAHGMAFATHGRTEIETPHAFCDYDNAEFAREAIRQLLARGRRKIALLGPPIFAVLPQAHGRGISGGHAAGGPARHCVRHDRHRRADERHESVRRGAGQVRRRARRVHLLKRHERHVRHFRTRKRALRIGRGFDLVAKQAAVPLHWYRSEIITIDEDFHAAGVSLAKAVHRHDRRRGPRLASDASEAGALSPAAPGGDRRVQRSRHAPLRLICRNWVRQELSGASHGNAALAPAHALCGARRSLPGAAARHMGPQCRPKSGEHGSGQIGSSTASRPSAARSAAPSRATASA